MNDVFVGRHSIFNRNKEVVAYELLFRNSLNNFFDKSVSSSKATSILLSNTYLNIGMEKLVEDKIAFINFDATLINNEIPSLLHNDRERIVVEVLEDVIPDKLLLSNLLDLKQKGYILALDDFTLDYEYKHTIPLYDIIKVDFMQSGLENAKKIIDMYSNGKRKFLAEKVETHEEFKQALEMGYDYFQGFFFTKPEIVKGKSTSKLNTQFIRLKEEMNKDEIDFKAISTIIESDVDLSYKLLRLVNSFSFSYEVVSIRHALAILGIKEIEKWINFIMVSDFASNRPDDMVRISVIRSRFAELLTENSNQKEKRYQASFVGLFSMIDVILGKSLKKVLNDIPMNSDVKDAIMLRPTSSLYNVMKIVSSYERADWDEIDFHAKKLDIPINIIPELYFQSVFWAKKYVFEIDEMQKEQK